MGGCVCQYRYYSLHVLRLLDNDAYQVTDDEERVTWNTGLPVHTYAIIALYVLVVCRMKLSQAEILVVHHSRNFLSCTNYR